MTFRRWGYRIEAYVVWPWPAAAEAVRKFVAGLDRRLRSCRVEEYEPVATPRREIDAQYHRLLQMPACQKNHPK